MKKYKYFEITNENKNENKNMIFSILSRSILN